MCAANNTLITSHHITEILKQAHMALVVPHAENAAALWAHGIVNVPELDKGERCALGWILGSTARMPEIVVRGELGMRAPQSRREAALLRLYFNLLSGRTLGLGKIVIVIVINVLFAAHTHVSMARPSL